MKTKTKISFLFIAGLILLLLPLFWAHGKIRPELELILYLPFDEGSGNTLEDKSETEADSKRRGAAWVKGKYGQALQFNVDGRENDNVQTRENERFMFQGHAEVTLMAWIKNEAGDWGDGINQYAVIYNRPVGNMANYCLRLEAPGFPALFYRDAADADWHRKTARGNPMPLGEWVHVTCSATIGQGDTMKFHVNGEELPSGWSHGNGNFKAIGAPGPIDIGSRLGGNGGHLFHGSIDEVMIWKGVFTTEDIKEIMSAPGDEFLAVQPQGKLATKWAAIKRRR